MAACGDNPPLVEHACTALHRLASSEACRNLVSIDAAPTTLADLLTRYESQRHLALLVLEIITQLALSEAALAGLARAGVFGAAVGMLARYEGDTQLLAGRFAVQSRPPPPALL